MDVAEPHLIHLRVIDDERGAITVGQIGAGLPFEVRRIFMFRPPPIEIHRGGHAHLKLQQMILCLHGAVTAGVEHQDRCRTFLLSKPSWALYVPPMTWLNLTLGRKAQVLVLASAEYDEADYIRDKAQFAA